MTALRIPSEVVAWGGDLTLGFVGFFNDHLAFRRWSVSGYANLHRLDQIGAMD